MILQYLSAIFQLYSYNQQHHYSQILKNGSLKLLFVYGQINNIPTDSATEFNSSLVRTVPEVKSTPISDGDVGYKF